MAAGYQEGDFQEGASREAKVHMHAIVMIQPPKSHKVTFAILCWLSHKILPWLKGWGHRPRHPMGGYQGHPVIRTWRMGDMVGHGLGKYSSPFIWVFSFLHQYCSHPAQFGFYSQLFPLSVEESPGWVTFKSSQGLDCSRPLGPCLGPLALPGFCTGQFRSLLCESGYWGFSSSQLWQTPLCSSLPSPTQTLILCLLVVHPHQLAICSLWATSSPSFV